MAARIMSSKASNAGAGNDWLLQVGGDQATVQVAEGGTGNDTIYQYGGQGNSNMAASCGR